MVLPLLFQLRSPACSRGPSPRVVPQVQLQGGPEAEAKSWLLTKVQKDRSQERTGP